MARCTRCGFDNREGVGFCEECGGRLERLCPSCGAAVPAGSKFCGKCGGQLVAGLVSITLDYSIPRSYTPSHLADKILTARDSLEGERKLVTVLFADVANFTSFSEKLDPEDVRRIMDDCFKILIEQIYRHEGTVDKFTGDGVMALFGAPLSHEDHAQRACCAALAIRTALEGYGTKIKQEFGVDFRMRLGLNSGLVVVGSVGNDLKMDYTAIGDTVNLASRIEDASQPGSVLLSENTYRLAKDFFRIRPRGAVQVKGKEKPVETYELIEPTGVASRIEASAARGLTRFVGRDKEIGFLKEAFEKAQSGFGQVVGIVGDAGVGKSRLLLELVGALAGQNYAFLEGRCQHYANLVPYLPFLDVLRSYFGLAEGDKESILRQKLLDKITQLDPKLEGILTPLEDTLGLRVESSEYVALDPQTRRTRVFEAIRDLLLRESLNRPIVLAIEDLHWIDKTSEELLGYLIGFLANARILLVLLYRPEYTHSWGSRSYYSRIGVSQLSTKASHDLVQSIFQTAEVAPELRELILARAAGNPLFIEEFTSTLLENGSIQRRNGQYVLTCDTSDIQVPDTIQGIISARMDRLEAQPKRIMQVASVIGRDFAFRILQTITGMREDLKAQLVNLQGLEFIYEKRIFPELEYIFKHALTQEVAYNTLLLKRRKEIHERIGRAIEQLYSDRLAEYYEMLAFHYSKSDDSEKAYRYLCLSGERALRRYANWEAFRFYKEAIKTLDRLPDSEEKQKEKIRVRMAIDSPIRLLSYPEGSLNILEDGERLARELRDERSLTSFCSSLGLYYNMRGQSMQGLDYAEKAFESAQRLKEPGLSAILAFDLCAAYNIGGQLPKVVGIARQAIDLIEATKSQDTLPRGAFNLDYYSALYAYCGHALGYQGYFGEGRDMCDKALGLASAKDDRYSMALAHVMFGYLCLLQGDWRSAIPHFEKGVRHQEEIGATIILGISHSAMGLAYGYSGNFELADVATKRARRLAEEHALSLSTAQYPLYEGMVHLLRGDFASARECCERSLSLARQTGQLVSAAISMVMLGCAIGRIEAGQPTRGVDTLTEGIKACDEQNLRPFSAQGHLFLSELYRNAGQIAEAEASLAKAELLFQEMEMEYWVPRVRQLRNAESKSQLGS